ncbi:MAG: diacylglycerol kinase family lipid kinase, partial [Aliifodinibius sp.]|nr:diacylglycerol kinase family lipid kinase [Fodinibius sp.]NIW78060.1 diacylglycerol kinase family lipid kinase [Calditrichia bacterium]
IDIGRAGEKYFVNGLGIGFDAEVVIETMKIKKLRGFFIYLYSVLKALKNYKNRLINLDINGETISRKVLMISVGNGRCLGGGFYLTPNAKLDDGLFDICIFRAMNRIEILTNLPKALKGKHLNLPQVQCLQTGHLIAQAADGMPIHMDGELLSLNSKKITIEIVPKALNIIHNC